MLKQMKNGKTRACHYNNESGSFITTKSKHCLHTIIKKICVCYLRKSFICIDQ